MSHIGVVMVIVHDTENSSMHVVAISIARHVHPASLTE